MESEHRVTGSSEDRRRPGTEVILYDGVCGLCNRFNRYILKKDRKCRFQFAPLQSAFARKALLPHGKDPRELDTIYLILDHGQESERVLCRGRAALKTLTLLGGPWRVAGLLQCLPTAVLDVGYNLLARNRYRFFGKSESCPVPDPRYRDRFLGID